MQLNYDFVICVVTYHHSIKIIVLKSKNKMKSFFFVAYVFLLLILISNPILNEESLLLHFTKSLFVLHSSLFLIGFHFKFN